MSEKKKTSGWWWLCLVAGIVLFLIGGLYAGLMLILSLETTTGRVEGYELYIGGTGARSNPHNHCYKVTIGYEVAGTKYTKTTRWPVKNFRDCERTPQEAAQKAETWIGREILIYYSPELPGSAESEGEHEDLAASTPLLALLGLGIIGWCIYSRRKSRRPPSGPR